MCSARGDMLESPERPSQDHRRKRNVNEAKFQAVVQSRKGLRYHRILEYLGATTQAGIAEQGERQIPKRVSCSTTTFKNSTRIMTE